MSNFWKRALFGTLFVALVIGAILIGKNGALVLFALITVLGLWELYTLCAIEDIYPQKIPGIILGVTPFIFIFLSSGKVSEALLLFAIIFPFILFFLELFRKAKKPFTNIALTFFGIIYISLPLCMLYLISLYPPKETGFIFYDYIYHPNNLLGYFFILWSYDTGAYLAGSKFGRHKLFERISPKKTWEGVIGGALLASIIAFFISIYFAEFLRTDWLIIALIIVITGTLGDLIKSKFKRSINIKDSGNIIPGHGGILDRFDALFLSAPFVLCYLLLTK